MRTLRKVAALGTSHFHTMQTTDRCEVSRQITSTAPSTCIRLDKVACSLLGKPGSNSKLRGFLSFLSAVRNVCANHLDAELCRSFPSFFCKAILYVDYRSEIDFEKAEKWNSDTHDTYKCSSVTGYVGDLI